MNYNLNSIAKMQEKTSTWVGLKKLLNLISDEKRKLVTALIAILLSVTLNLGSPLLIGYTIDHYIQTKQFNGVLSCAGILLIMYLLAFMTSYYQTQLMGGLGQRVIFTLRNSLFNKIQQLPVEFFNTNKAGDLISRVNNDTDKLSQFFSQALTQFISSMVTMTGAAIFLLLINVKLGLATLVPAVFIIGFTRIIGPLVKAKNAANLKSTGSLSAEIQESLNNFKVTIAFNRRDYFRKRFDQVNRNNYKTAIISGLVNNAYLPVFRLFSGLAQLIVLAYGIYLVMQESFTVGLLVSYLAYATSFYNPLNQLASLWSSFQVALASWDRISQILTLENNLPQIADQRTANPSNIIEFKQVHFGYPDGQEILHGIDFKLERGKTYALVGPTGGGKSTTASLMARLYDPQKGEVLLSGKDIRSYSAEELTHKIGFILQEPFLFTGSVKENILYGNLNYQTYSDEELIKLINEGGLEKLLDSFEDGLQTTISSTGDSMSLGQKQLIAFMRAVLRKPELLILDEATANIDTITEQLLEKILANLPVETTVVIIAHRLNTIERADGIFFVSSGTLSPSLSFHDAVNKFTSS